MKNIQLLTMNSYLKEKKELVENANYTFEELHIDNDNRINEMISETKREYFEQEGEFGEQYFFPFEFLKDGDYFEIMATTYIKSGVFLEGLKSRYSQLIQKQQYVEIVNDIEKAFSNEFINICESPSSHMKRVYEIVKYTLSGETRCDYLHNGQFIREMSENDIFPFEMVNDSLPIYCQNMQRVLFGVHRKIFTNLNSRASSLDITRFSFYNVKKIVDAVTQKLKEGEDYKEDSEDYNKGYIEGAEDYILLDKILGISLTNIIYWKTKGIEKRELQDNIIEIVSSLAKCHFSTGRNSVAEVLFDYLEATDYNEYILQEVREILKKKIKTWNEYYEEVEAVILCPIFDYLKDCSEKVLIDICKDKGNDSKENDGKENDGKENDGKENNGKESDGKKDNSWNKDTWSEYIYMEVIAEDSKRKENKLVIDNKKEDKIRIPKGNMDNRTWYAYIHKTVFDAIWD